MAGVYIARRNNQVTGQVGHVILHLMRPLSQLSNMVVTFMGGSLAIPQYIYPSFQPICGHRFYGILTWVIFVMVVKVLICRRKQIRFLFFRGRDVFYGSASIFTALVTTNPRDLSCR